MVIWNFLNGKLSHNGPLLKSFESLREVVLQVLILIDLQTCVPGADHSIGDKPP
jgi:hypothetical protein